MRRLFLISAALLVFPVCLRAGTKVVASDARRVVVRYEPGPVQLTDDGLGSVRVEVPGADYPARPGEPGLPARIVRVGIPQTGGVSVRVRSGSEQVFADVTVAPATAVWSGL